MINTIIFDVGGTLLGAPDLFLELSNIFNDIPDKKSIYDKLKIEVMKGIEESAVKFYCIADILKTALSELSTEFGFNDMGIYAKDIYHRVFVEKSFLFGDTISTLQTLKANGIRMIVASDADSELLYEEFNNFQLDQYFEKLIISSEISSYKPNDKFVEALASYVSGSKNNTIIVGDSTVDVQTGEKLGIKTVLKGDKVPEGVLPDYHIKNLAAILDII